MHVATVLMDMYDSHIRPGIQDVCDGRDWLREALTAAGYPTRGRLSNFVLSDMGSVEAVERTVAGLKARGYFVRPFGQHLQITCGSPPLMHRFFEAFCSVTEARHAA